MIHFGRPRWRLGLLLDGWKNDLKTRAAESCGKGSCGPLKNIKADWQTYRILEAFNCCPRHGGGFGICSRNWKMKSGRSVCWPEVESPYEMAIFQSCFWSAHKAWQWHVFSRDARFFLQLLKKFSIIKFTNKGTPGSQNLANHEQRGSRDLNPNLSNLDSTGAPRSRIMPPPIWK